MTRQPKHTRRLNCLTTLAVAAFFLVVPAEVSQAQDLVEFLSGAKTRGKVLQIRKAEKEFDFETKIGRRTLTRTYPFDRVHAVTMKGKRYVLNKKGAARSAGADGVSARRSKTEILKLIDDTGRMAPEWFESTELSYPPTLDLAWPLKPEGNWNNQKNMGQYIWDVINPNPNRWRSGVKLIHHCMTLHTSDANLLRRDMRSLGTMYFQLFQDYPRAAFWHQQATFNKGTLDGVLVAECYWRLGNKRMALDTLKAKRLNLQAIKLFGDMGETETAVQLANAFSRTQSAQQAYLLAGDALRLAGKFPLAIEYYQKVLEESDGNEDYVERWHGRARDSIQAIRVFDLADVGKVADGSYTDSAIGYNADIHVQVKVAKGRIEDVQITEHEEKQFYSAITDTTSQIIKKQSVRNIDATSRATITSQAIVNAAAKALAQGAAVGDS